MIEKGVGKLEIIEHEAAVIIAKCRKSKKPFGIRTEKMSDGAWHCTWAFITNEKTVLHEKYCDTPVSGRIIIDAEYPGCLYCDSTGWFCCNVCNRLTCYANERYVTCAWCGNNAETIHSDSFRLRGSEY